MDRETNVDSTAPAARPPDAAPRPHPVAAMAPTLAVLAVAVAAVVAAVLATRPDTPAPEHRAAASPPPGQEVVHAPPLNGMGAGPACQSCGVVEAVTAVQDGKDFQMRIRMDDGSLRTVEQRGAMAAGTRVVVEGGTVRLLPRSP